MLDDMFPLDSPFHFIKLSSNLNLSFNNHSSQNLIKYMLIPKYIVKENVDQQYLETPYT